MNVKNVVLSLVLCAGCLPMGKVQADEAKKMSLDDCKVVLEKLKTDGQIKQYKLDPGAEAGLLKLDLSHSGIIDLAPLKGMPLEWLHIDGDDGDPSKVTSLTGLEGMPLKEISLCGNIALEDMSALKGAPLKVFKLGGTHDGRMPKVKDLGMLKGMNLTYIWLPAAEIEDLSPLIGMKLEGGLIMCGSKDVNALKGMPMKSFWLGGAVTNISGFQGSQLKDLSLHGANKLMDLSPLKGVPLESISLGGCQMESLHGLEGMQIKNLSVPPNVSDLTPLKDMPLESLSFEGKEVSDISLLKTIKTLKSLNLRGAPISDIEALKGLKLVALNLGETKVTDISVLSGVPLIELNLFNTPVKDISPLAGSPLKNLCLSACTNLLSLKPLGECKELEAISLPDKAGDVEFLRKMPNLKFITTAPCWDIGQVRGQTAADFWKKLDEGKK